MQGTARQHEHVCGYVCGAIKRAIEGVGYAGSASVAVAGAQNAAMQATERSFIGRRIKGRRREGKVPPKPLRWC
jgi:hypothetical protein